MTVVAETLDYEIDNLLNLMKFLEAQLVEPKQAKDFDLGHLVTIYDLPSSSITALFKEGYLFEQGDGNNKIVAWNADKSADQESIQKLSNIIADIELSGDYKEEENTEVKEIKEKIDSQRSEETTVKSSGAITTSIANEPVSKYHWENKHVRELIRLTYKGLNRDQIAKKIDKTPSAVYQKALTLKNSGKMKITPPTKEGEKKSNRIVGLNTLSHLILKDHSCTDILERFRLQDSYSFIGSGDEEDKVFRDKKSGTRFSSEDFADIILMPLLLELDSDGLNDVYRWAEKNQEQSRIRKTDEKSSSSSKKENRFSGKRWDEEQATEIVKLMVKRENHSLSKQDIEKLNKLWPDRTVRSIDNMYYRLKNGDKKKLFETIRKKLMKQEPKIEEKPKIVKKTTTSGKGWTDHETAILASVMLQYENYSVPSTTLGKIHEAFEGRRTYRAIENKYHDMRKGNQRKTFDKMIESDWFIETYKDASLGDFIEGEGIATKEKPEEDKKAETPNKREEVKSSSKDDSPEQTEGTKEEFDIKAAIEEGLSNGEDDLAEVIAMKVIQKQGVVFGEIMHELGHLKKKIGDSPVIEEGIANVLNGLVKYVDYQKQVNTELLSLLENKTEDNTPKKSKKIRSFSILGGTLLKIEW